MGKGTIRNGLLVALGLVLAGCQESTTESLDRQAFHARRAAVLATFESCPRNATTVLAGMVAESLCTHFSVPEDYAEPDGRRIDLKVMVIPSLNDLPEPDPLFLLAGGPGQAATDLVQAAQVFARLRTDRDIVLVDQRGTGELSPFDCQLDEEEMRALEARDPDFEETLAIQLDVLHECLAATDARPELYTTDIAMRDLDAVRDYLGYDRLNLWGASYGSRAALAYLQAYPDFTRTVIIDAIAPPALTLPLFTGRDASASLEAVFADCAADSQCSEAYPDLAAHYRELLARLATPEPVTVTVDSDFSTLEGSLAAYEIQDFLRQVLYSREAQRLVPLIIEQAWAGNYRPVFALASQYGEAQINQGMFLSVICSEDYSRLSAARLEAEAGVDYLIESELFTRFVLEACAFWPKRQVPDAYFEPVTADRPVLIFSGALDPVTPPQWGDLVHASLPDAEHLVLEGFGHGTLLTQCTAGIMHDFIDSGALEGLDTGCTGTFRRRPFLVTPGGSTLADD